MHAEVFDGLKRRSGSIQVRKIAVMVVKGVLTGLSIEVRWMGLLNIKMETSPSVHKHIAYDIGILS